MTNLSGTSSPLQKALTRQRLLVGAPLLFGVLIGAGLFAIFGLPDWLASNQRTLRIAELNSQKQSLPLIENQVRQAEQNLLAAQQQQDLVVSLVAGRGKIQTFLTQLSRASAESGVVIERYEPVSVATASIDSSENSTKVTHSGSFEPTENKLSKELSTVILSIFVVLSIVKFFSKGIVLCTPYSGYLQSSRHIFFLFGTEMKFFS